MPNGNQQTSGDLNTFFFVSSLASSEDPAIVDQLNLNHHLGDIGKISSRFQDHEDSSESEESVDESPWLSLWLPYNPWYNSQLASPPLGPGDPLDLYIDSIHLLPQHILLAKVHYLSLLRWIYFPLLEVSCSVGLHQLEALPVLESSATSPSFRSRLEINQDGQWMDSQTCVELKVGHLFLPSFISRGLKKNPEVIVGGVFP